MLTGKKKIDGVFNQAKKMVDTLCIGVSINKDRLSQIDSEKETLEHSNIRAERLTGKLKEFFDLE